MSTLHSHIQAAKYRQHKYFGAEFNILHLKSLLTYVVEETVEVNRELTAGEHKYKSFKADKPVDKTALASEIADLVIHVLNAAGVAEELFDLDVDLAVKNKLRYNYERPDHTRVKN